MISRKNISVAVAQDMATSFNSAPIDVRDLVMGAVQIVITGTPVGSFKLQSSNDTYQFIKQPEPQPTPTNWTDVDSSTFAVSAAGTIMYNLTAIGYDLLRVVYTATSGTGTATIRMVGKG